MRHFAPLLIALVMVSLGDAREPQTVKVERHERIGNGAIEVRQGSGVLCGSTSDKRIRCVLTVAHVAGASGDRVRVQVGGRWHIGRVVESDRELDAALVIIDGRHCKHVTDARLWLGEVSTHMNLRTEGFPAGRFREVSGRPIRIRPDGRLVGTGGVKGGTSGGPVYVVSSTHSASFITVASHSDEATVQMGPYRDGLIEMVETCNSGALNFSFNRRGTIDAIPRAPRRQLDAPIVVPEPDTSQQDEKQELMNQLKELLRERAAEETSKKSVSRAPKIDRQATEGEVVTLDVPVRVRVRVKDGNVVLESVQ